MPDSTWTQGSAKVSLDDHTCFVMDPGTPIQAYAEMEEIAAPELPGRTCGYAVRENIQRGHQRTVHDRIVTKLHYILTPFMGRPF